MLKRILGPNFYQSLVGICNQIQDILKNDKKIFDIAQDNKNTNVDTKKIESNLIDTWIPFGEYKKLTNQQKVEISSQNAVILLFWGKINNYFVSFQDFIIQTTKNGDDKSPSLFFLRNIWTYLSSSNQYHCLTNQIQFLYDKYEIKQLDSNNQIFSPNIFIQTFYFPFLIQYNSQIQKERGVVFTPQIVLKSIFLAAHYLLKEIYLIEPGLLSDKILFYDPATGPLVFEEGLISTIQSFLLDSKDKIYNWYDEQFLANFIGHELDPISYFIGRFLLADFLSIGKKSSGLIYRPLAMHFENALSPYIPEKLIPIEQYRNKIPFIFGNPPYSVSSANKDPWIYSLMESYAVNEPNITRLYDDYVKFIRYGQYIIEKAGKGIIAFITNRKFLDGKIYYGMRKSLLSTFDRIYIIDLFGDTRNIKQKSSNINIFGIQTGVAISYFLKKESDHSDFHKSNIKKEADVYYIGIHGNLEELKMQLDNPFQNFNFQIFSPESPQCLFVPLNISSKIQKIWLERTISLPKCFKKTSRAMISSRDDFMIHIDASSLTENVHLLANRDYKTLRKLQRIRKTFDPLLENEQIINKFDFKTMVDHIYPINYRPLDFRHCIYYTINQRCGKSIILDQLKQKITPPSVEEKNDLIAVFEKSEILTENLLMLTPIAFNFVQSVQKPPFSHIWISYGIIDSGLFGYSTSKVAPFINDEEINLSIEYLDAIKKVVLTPTTLELFGYIYGVLNWDFFINTFESLLLHEFPRVILPPTQEFFRSIAFFGCHLMKLHLEIFSNEEISRFHKRINDIGIPSSTSGKLLNYHYNSEKLLLEINLDSTNSISIPCSKSTWEFYIGSIKILDHWLASRKYIYLKRAITNSEINYLMKMIFIIDETRKIQNAMRELWRELP